MRIESKKAEAGTTPAPVPAPAPEKPTLVF
jgi:hypothetical protein